MKADRTRTALSGAVQYSERDRERLFRFLKQVWKNDPERYDPKIWEWRFGGPHHAQPNIVLFKLNDDVIGEQCGVPIVLRIDNEYVDMVCGQDLIVLEQYRSKGVGYLLQKQWLQITPNMLVLRIGDEAHRLMTQLGFMDLSHVGSNFNKLLNSETLLRDILKSGMLAGVLSNPINRLTRMIFRTSPVALETNQTLTEIQTFSKEYDCFFENVAEDYEIIVKKDSTYLNWRYVDRPDGLVHRLFELREGDSLRGFLVLRIDENKKLTRGLVVELICALTKKEYFSNLLRHAVAYFEDHSVDIIQFWTTNKRYYDQIRSEGFVKRESKIRFMVRLDPRKYEEAYLRNERNWFLSYGDSDDLGQVTESE